MAKKRRWVWIITGLALGVSALSIALFKPGATEDIAHSYDFEAVRKMDLRETVEVTGKVYPLEKKDLYSDYPGVVESVAVKAGDHVEEGEVLLTIHSSSLREKWDQAQSKLKQAKINYDKARVQLGTEIALNRVNLDNLVRVESYTHQLNLYREQVKEAEQQINALQEKNDGYYVSNHESLSIRAPFSGQVAWLAVKPGDKITTDLLLVTMMKADALGVEALIDQNDIGLLQVGQTAIALGKDPKQTENLGEVSEISAAGQAENEIINFPIRITMRSGSRGLQAGMSVDLTIVTTEYPDVVAIPAASVGERNGRRTVKIRQGDHIREVFVELGYQQGKYWQVKSGLKVGDQVAVPKAMVARQTSEAGKFGGMGGLGR